MPTVPELIAHTFHDLYQYLGSRDEGWALVVSPERKDGEPPYVRAACAVGGGGVVMVLHVRDDWYQPGELTVSLSIQAGREVVKLTDDPHVVACVRVGFVLPPLAPDTLPDWSKVVPRALSLSRARLDELAAGYPAER